MMIKLKTAYDLYNLNENGLYMICFRNVYSSYLSANSFLMKEKAQTNKQRMRQLCKRFANKIVKEQQQQQQQNVEKRQSKLKIK